MVEVVHLDINIVEHCNLSCTACSHLSPLHKPWRMSLEEIERDLEALRPILKPKNITVVGGEPLLHPELLQILQLLKRLRVDEQTWLITNGTLLPRMSEEFWGALEYMRVSVYPTLDKTIPDMVRGQMEKHAFECVFQEFTEFFLQLDVVPDGSSFHDCPWKSDCYTVHRGFFYLCPQSTFFPRTLLNLPADTDGLPLEGITEEKLLEFMNRKEPFVSCRSCRAYGQAVPWSETRGREKWIANSTLPTVPQQA